MEILNRREQIGAKKLPPVIGEDVEKAGKSKYGVVKIGDGINVNNGVISVPAQAAAVVIELPNNDGTPSDLSAETLTALNAALTAETPIVLKYTVTEVLDDITETKVYFWTEYYIYSEEDSSDPTNDFSRFCTFNGSLGASLIYDLTTGEFVQD